MHLNRFLSCRASEQHESQACDFAQDHGGATEWQAVWSRARRQRRRRQQPRVSFIIQASGGRQSIIFCMAEVEIARVSLRSSCALPVCVRASSRLADSARPAQIALMMMTAQAGERTRSASSQASLSARARARVLSASAYSRPSTLWRRCCCCHDD